MTQELERLLPVKEGEIAPQVLVPGAGLGRLCVEIAARGYAAQVL